MKVVYFKFPARIALNSISRINLCRIFILLISIFVFKSFPSYSSESNRRTDFDNYDWTHLKRHNFLPKIASNGIDPNYKSLNTLLKTSYSTGESSFLYADAQCVFNSGNVFSIVLSDSVGSFSNPTVIGTLGGFATGVKQIYIRYYISNESISKSLYYSKLVRGHWSIERFVSLAFGCNL